MKILPVPKCTDERLAIKESDMKKQFIWIMSDSTRYDMIGCYGNPIIHTPCLDALAGEGLRFDRAYTTQPVCGPARSALFTGQFPHSNQSWGNCMPLGADVLTLGQRLHEKGIPCAYIGKWHLDGGDYFGNGVCPPGWDENYWFDMKNYLDELTPEERVFSRKPESNFIPGGIKSEFTFAHRCTDRALRFMETHKDEDFFLVLSFDEPHDPGLCPEPYCSMYLDKKWEKNPAHYDVLKDKPLYQQLWGAGGMQADRDALEPMNARLLGCNSYVDSQAGRVIDRAHELLPDATLMYTSDHGDGMEEHCLWAKGPTAYDGIARVPLIMAGPHVAKNKVYEGVVSHIDLPATVLDYMGVSVPRCFEGESLLPLMADPDHAPHRDEAFVEFARYEIDHDGFGGFQPMRAIVTNRYKLQINLLDEDELYDLEQDPHELENCILHPEYVAVRNRLHDRLIEWMNETRDPFRGYQWQCRPWREDKKPSWAVDGMTRQRKQEEGGYRQLDYMTGLPMRSETRVKGES